MLKYQEVKKILKKEKKSEKKWKQEIIEINLKLEERRKNSVFVQEFKKKVEIAKKLAENADSRDTNDSREIFEHYQKLKKAFRSL